MGNWDSPRSPGRDRPQDLGSSGWLLITCQVSFRRPWLSHFPKAIWTCDKKKTLNSERERSRRIQEESGHGETESAVELVENTTYLADAMAAAYSASAMVM